MMDREFLQQLLAARRELEQDLAAVVFAAAAFHQVTPSQTVHQFHCTVMLDLQALGKLANATAAIFRQTFQGQQEQVLLRFQAGRPRSLLAEPQKAANLITKFSHGPVIRRGSAGAWCHPLTFYRNTRIFVAAGIDSMESAWRSDLHQQRAG